MYKSLLDRVVYRLWVGLYRMRAFNMSEPRPYLNYLNIHPSTLNPQYNVFQQRFNVPPQNNSPPKEVVDLTLASQSVTQCAGVTVESTDEVQILDVVPAKTKPKLLDRRWESARPPTPTNAAARETVRANRSMHANSVNLSVASYNVLCQATISETSYLYNHCREQHLSWAHRWNLLQHELDSLDADVVCLQEVQIDHYQTCYRPFMQSRGYEGVFKKRTGTKPDGCATFWRVSKLNCVEQRAVEYFVPGAPVLNRDNIALLVALEAKESKSESKLIVANTHLLYNPNRGDVKLAQISKLLAHVDQMCNGVEKRGDNCAILCGDLNIEPLCPLYELLMTGQLQYVGLPQAEISGQGKVGGKILQHELLPQHAGVTDSCLLNSVWAQRSCSAPSKALSYAPNGTGRLSHDHQLMSVYRHVTSSRDFEVSSYHKDSSAVDYIFYSLQDKKAHRRSDEQLVCKDIVEGRLKCTERLALLSERELERSVGRLPNANCGSDHLPLMARFVWHP